MFVLFSDVLWFNIAMVINPGSQGIPAASERPVFAYPEDVMAIARINNFPGGEPWEAAKYLGSIDPEIGRAAMHLLDIHHQLGIIVDQVGLVDAATSDEVRGAIQHAAKMSAILLGPHTDSYLQNRTAELTLSAFQNWAYRDFGVSQHKKP